MGLTDEKSFIQYPILRICKDHSQRHQSDHNVLQSYLFSVAILDKDIFEAQDYVQEVQLYSAAILDKDVFEAQEYVQEVQLYSVAILDKDVFEAQEYVQEVQLYGCVLYILSVN